MKPSVMLLGFLLGSSGSICFGLLGVALIFWVLAPEHPQLANEIGLLLTHIARFIPLAAASGMAFYGVLTQRSWRRIAVTVLAVVAGVVVLSYVP